MAKHSPPGDTSFSWSLVRHLAAAVALVAVVAAGFWGIGQLQDDSSPEHAAAPTSTPDETATSEPAPTDGAATPADGATSDPSPATSPADEATADPAQDDATAAPAQTETEDDAPTPADDAVEDDGTRSGDVDPAEISVQVLDATGGDAAAAAEVADTLRADGFRVIAENRAVRGYDVTTVFYTPGNEAKAEQLAAMYGYREVAPEPGNLSHSVDLHVVVGADA